MSDHVKVEWSIERIEDGHVLVPLHKEATVARFKAIEEDEPGKYRLVSRTVQYGDWVPYT